MISGINVNSASIHPLSSGTARCLPQTWPLPHEVCSNRSFSSDWLPITYVALYHWIPLRTQDPGEERGGWGSVLIHSTERAWPFASPGHPCRRGSPKDLKLASWLAEAGVKAMFTHVPAVLSWWRQKSLFKAWKKNQSHSGSFVIIQHCNLST